jgi:putative FmdB family regulatory protein
MPNYVYNCAECDERYEKMLTYKEYAAELHCCPLCGAKGKKVVFAPPFHSRLSLMHPRHMRGQRGKFKKQEGNVIE